MTFFSSFITPCRTDCFGFLPHITKSTSVTFAFFVTLASLVYIQSEGVTLVALSFLDVETGCLSGDLMASSPFLVPPFVDLTEFRRSEGRLCFSVSFCSFLLDHA